MGKFLRDVNTIMSIGAKAHYMSGGNTRKADPMAKPQYKLEDVAELTGYTLDNVKQMLIANGIINEQGYILNNAYGQGIKFNDYLVQALITPPQQQKQNTFLWYIICFVFAFGCLTGLCTLEIPQAVIFGGISYYAGKKCDWSFFKHD